MIKLFRIITFFVSLDGIKQKIAKSSVDNENFNYMDLVKFKFLVEDKNELNLLVHGIKVLVEFLYKLECFLKHASKNIIFQSKIKIILLGLNIRSQIIRISDLISFASPINKNSSNKTNFWVWVLVI